MEKDNFVQGKFKRYNIFRDEDRKKCILKIRASLNERDRKSVLQELSNIKYIIENKL